MKTTIRRMLLLVTLMFWQGGFMFYGGVVVPVGAEILASDTKQGFVTQAVTNYLNVAGAVCLVVWLEYLWHHRRGGVSMAEWWVWLLMAISLVGLVGVHFQMDRILIAETTTVSEPKQFDLLHKLYIGTSSLQWLLSLVLLFLTLRSWNQADVKRSC
ncbi:MAG: hypothetical protein WCH39_04520 [Schlesneria sp.]|jgi:hypothetical protein